LKILTIVWSIGVGGTERAAVNYAIGYKQHGHDSKMLVLGEGDERLMDLQEAEVDTCFVKRDARNEDEVYASFKTWGPDIIHLHNFNVAFIPYLDKVKNVFTKVVETNHFSRPVYDESYKAISLSMQLSQWGYWKYNRWMKNAAYIPHVALVPNIINAKKFIAPSKENISAFRQLHGIPADAFVAGRLGQAHPSKWDSRIFDVIEKTVKQENRIYFFFVGLPAVMKKELEEKSEFIKSRIKLIDSIHGDENLSLYYHSLNCFAHISKIGESFGFVLAEALMCKVPVITMLTPYHDNAQLEVVEHNYGGLCVIDTSSFVSSVMQLYNSQEECERFRKNLDNHWIEKKFGATAVVPKQVEYFKQLLNGKQIETLNVNEVIKNCFSLYGATGYIRYLFLKIYNCRLSFIFLKSLKKLFR
jgi:glycosyltransferase involved in cell wall biosynthesis